MPSSQLSDRGQLEGLAIDREIFAPQMSPLGKDALAADNFRRGCE